MSFPLTQNPGGSEPGPLAVPKTNTIPGTSVPSGAQTGAPNPYTQYGASVRAVNDVQSAHAINLIKIKDKYRNAKLFNPSQPDEDREIENENKRYAADLSRAKGFEAQMINQVRSLTKGNITGWLFGDGSDGTTRDVMLKNLSVFNTNGQYKASRSKVSVIADKVAKELGGDDYLATFLTNEMSAEIDRIHAGIGVKKTAASILSSQRFATFAIDKDGNITSILQDQVKNSIDATRKVDLENTLKSYRQTATYNIRKEQEEASLTFLKPKLDELQAKYTPVLEGIGKDVSSRYVEKVNKELSEYGVYLQEEVKAGRMKYSTAVSQLRMAETNANNELKRSEKKIQQETQDIFDNSPMGKEYQSAVAQVRSEFKNMASAITKKHNGLYLLQAKPLVNSYNEYVKQVAANLDALQAKELVAIQKAYNSAGDQYAVGINNYYKSKKTIDIFADNVVANIGNLLKGIGYKLESSGITGELVDNMKYGGQDAFNRFVIQTPELSLKNFADPKVAAGAMSQLAYALPGLVTGIASGGIGLGAKATQYIAGTAAWLSNSLMMQGDTRDQALQNGFTESYANDAARKMGIQQLAYLPVAFMSANVLFGKIPTLRSGVVKGALSTTGEWFQETSESGGQKVYVDPMQKTTFAEAFMRHDTQMEGVTAAYSQLVMNTASLLLRGLVKFPGVKFGRNKAAIHAPDIQHVASAINNTGNESTSDMVLEFMEDEGAVTPEVAEAHRARFETAKRRLQSAKDAGMNDEQAQLYVAAKQDLDDKKQALGDIEDSEIKAVTEKEIQELEKKIQGIIDGSVPVVTLSVQGMTLTMTPEDAEQSVEEPLVAEAIASGDVEMTGPEDVVAKLREAAAALSASNAPVGDVEMVAPQENVGDIAIIPNTEDNGQRQEGQEDGRQDVLSPPEPITAEPTQPGPVDMIVDSPAVVGEAVDSPVDNAPAEPAVVEEAPKKKRSRSKKVAEAQVIEQAEPVVSDVAPEVVTPEAAPVESTPVEEVAPPVQEVKAAPAQVKADAKPLSEMTAKEKKDEGKKYIKSIDDYFSKVFPALGIGKPDVAQIKSKSLTGKYNKALDLLRNEAITSDEFDAIKKRLLAAADKSRAYISEAVAKDEYMEGVRKEIEEKKKKSNTAIREKPATQEQSKALAEAVRSAKIDMAKDALFSNPIGVAAGVWNASIELIALTVEAGGSVLEGVQKAVKYIIENYGDKNNLNETVVKNSLLDYLRNSLTLPNDSQGIQSQSTRDGRRRQEGGSLAPLEGAPIIQGATGPDPSLVAAAERYAAQKGITFIRQGEYVKISPEFSTRIASAYSDMQNAPNDPVVKEAYQNLIRQTIDQYMALVDAGYTFSFFDSNTDPYEGNPYNAMRDLRKNKRMAVYGTYDGYGTEGITGAELDNNPMLVDTGLRWLDQKGVERIVTANDLFRAVHDAFGHGLEGSGFRARGEENAWQSHVRLFTGSAIAALTSETRGQNSWLNYGPYGEKNRDAKLEDTIFAEQKVGLMPSWTWEDGRAADEVDDNSRSSMNVREVASRLRELAKKANKGEAYESLLGLPIAAYQATLNLIANLLEAGATITEAINAGAEYVKAQLQGEKFSDAEIRQALVANLNAIGIIENQEPGDIKKQIDSQYPTQYTNAKGQVITRSPIIRAQMSLKDLAKKSFSQGARAVEAVKELQKLLRNNIELYGLKKFSLGTFKKMIAILQSIGPDYDATDVYDLVAGIDDALLYEANLDKVKEINKKLRQVKQLIRSGMYVKSSYETALADVFAFAVSPFKVLKYANDPVAALFEYEKTLDAIIKGFGSRQGFRGFDKNDLLDWAEKMKATAEEIAIAEENDARSRFDELVKSDKYEGTKNYEEYVNEQKVIKEQEQEEKKAQRLVDSRDAVVNYQRVISLMQDILRNKIASGDFSYDKFIEDVAREIAAVDTNKLIRQEGFTERQEQMDENAEHMRRLSQLNDILNNILHDGDVNEAYAFIDKYITTPDAIKEMTAEAVKVRPITNPDKKNITNLINSMFFNKKFNTLFRLKLYQGFAFMMNRAKNIYYGIEGSGKDGVAKQFTAIISKHLGNDITDLSRYKLGVVNMLIQYAREAGDETAAKRFDKAVARIIDIEINKMATYADGSVNPNMGRKFNKSYEMTRKAIEELGLMIPNPSSVFMDSNGTLAPLIAMLNEGERELNNFMYAELNNPNYVNALKNSASANMGIDFEVIENYFPMYVYTFQGEPKVVGLNIGNMTKSMNGMRRMYVRPSDRNKKRSDLAGEDKYYSMDAFTNFLSAYYEGLSQIHAGREAMKMQYLLNSPQFQGIMGGALNRMLGFTKKSNATANIDIMNDKIQEIFDDYMRPMGIYSNFDSTMSKVFDWAKDTMMGVYLKHPAQAWNQYVPNAAAVMIQVGPTYFYNAIRAQSLAIVGSDSDKAAYRDFMANFTVSHRSTMGVIDDVSKQIQTSRLRKILGNAIDTVSEKVLLGFTLQYSDSAIANATTIASYIKSLVDQGIINSPSEFTVTMMREHAVRPNMIALTRAEAETTEINNSSLKEERASIVKDNKYKQPAIGTQEKIDRNLQFAYMLKGFAMNSYMHMRDAMKRLTSGANATPDDKVEAAREMFASISQIFIFNALKVGVTGPLYTMIGVAIYSALMGSKPDEETEEERKQRMSSAWWRFVLNTFFDGILGGSSAILEGLAKFTVGQGVDQGIKAYIDKEKAGGKEATMPYFYMDIKTPPQTGSAKLNYNVNPYGKVANRYREPFMGSVEPAFDIAKSVWEMTPIGFEENKKLNDEGNELLFKAKISMIAAIMFRSGGLDRLEGQFEKALKSDPKYKKASSGGRSSGGGPFNKTFGGSPFGKTFGN